MIMIITTTTTTIIIIIIIIITTTIIIIIITIIIIIITIKIITIILPTTMLSPPLPPPSLSSSTTQLWSANYGSIRTSMEQWEPLSHLICWVILSAWLVGAPRKPASWATKCSVCSFTANVGADLGVKIRTTDMVSKINASWRSRATRRAIRAQRTSVSAENGPTMSTGSQVSKQSSARGSVAAVRSLFSHKFPMCGSSIVLRFGLLFGLFSLLKPLVTDLVTVIRILFFLSR